MREQRPDLEIQWLTQSPVAEFLERRGEVVHPASRLLANESGHFESESGEHDLHAFQAVRRMDEILVNNFMVFDDLVERDPFDLWLGDEAWDLDYFLHENPDLKRAPFVWMTDFVGWVPMPDGGEREAFLTSDYNAQMVEHVARYPALRDRSVFVGDPADVVDLPLGPDLPTARAWTEEHFDFAGYVMGERPDPARREELRHRLGYADGEVVCVVSVGGSGVGDHLLRRVVASYDEARRRIPGLRMVVVTGPRIDPASIGALPGRCRGARLPPRPRPAPRRVRRGRRPGRAQHDDGADRGAAAVPVLPARPPLRAAGARAAPAGAAPGGAGDGLPRRRPGPDRRRAGRGAEEPDRLPRRCRPTARRARLSWCST